MPLPRKVPASFNEKVYLFVRPLKNVLTSFWSQVPHSRATTWVTVLPLLLFVSLYYDTPEQLSDVVDTSSIAEGLAGFPVFGVTISPGWVFATCIAIFQWVLLRRSIVVLDEFLRRVKSAADANTFWQEKAGQFRAGGGWVNRTSANLIDFLHKRGVTGRHFISMRVVLFSYIQIVLIMLPGLIVITLSMFLGHLQPAVAYYCAFLLLLQIGTSISTVHLAFNAGVHWSGLFSLIPGLILTFGLVSTGMTALVLVGILLASVLVWGPAFIATQVRDVPRRVTGARIVFGALVAAYLPIQPSAWQENDTIFSDRDQVTEPVQPVEMKKTEVVDVSKPLVFLTMGGGGSRAAIFNGLILERLWWIEPIPADDARVKRYLSWISPATTEVVLGPDPKDPAKKKFYPGRLLLIDARFVSSVSGGSLALIHWNFETMRAWERLKAGDSKFIELPAEDQRALALKEVFEPKGSLPFEEDDIALSRGERVPDDLVETIEANPTVAAMRGNFLAAVICGAFNPFSSRVNSLAAMWEEKFSWTIDKNPVRLSKLKDLEAQSILPFALLNTTRTKNGERMAITNLDQDWFAGRENFGVAPEQKDLYGGLRFNTVPGRVTTHTWFNRHWDPTLAHAVFASSDFPIGFPIHRFKPTADKTRPNEPPEGSTDGGVLENTGTNTAISVLRQFTEYRETKKALVPRIFLLQIDTSELPSNPGKSREVVFNIEEAKNTMQRVERIQEQALLEYHVAELAWMMTSSGRPKLKKSTFDVIIGGHPQQYIFGFGQPKWGWFNIRAGEFENEHVPTSWHLSKRSRRVLYRMAFSDIVTKSLRGSAEAYFEMLIAPIDNAGLAAVGGLKGGGAESNLQGRTAPEAVSDIKKEATTK